MRSRGFTILEVLLALGLLALLLMGVMTLLWVVGDSRERMTAEARRSQAAGTLLERLESDLLTCVAGDASVGAGVRGDATSVTVLSRGVWLTGPDEARRAVVVESPTVESPEWAMVAARLGTDLVGAKYEQGGAGAGLVMTRWAAGPGGGDGRSARATLEEIEAIRLRYFDGRAWSETFNSLEADALPAAVEVAVWLRTGTKDRRAEAGRAEAAVSDAPAERTTPSRHPDRVRVIAVPDGGVRGEGGGA